MGQKTCALPAVVLAAALHHGVDATGANAAPGAPAQGAPAVGNAADGAACEALLHLRNLTITHAGLSDTAAAVSYCYVRGILPPAIHFHVQLPLPTNWNGRFLKWGDGGKDGDLDFADHRVAEGYAVANSNTGHDNGAEPGSSFAYDNRQAEIDFGYRAVHLTVAAARTLVRSYYGEDPVYSYFEGCSTGGRQGLMEAQRYPTDFDGIVAGAPANHYQEMNAVRVWLLQRMFRDDFGAALAFDADGDGRFDSVRKLDHCRGGAGPDTWDRLQPLVDWVEHGSAPDALIATHATDGVVDNERPICAYPQRAVCTGPDGGADDPANWVAGNFICR